MKLHFYDYRYADAVLDHPRFVQAKKDIVEILTAAPTPLLKPALTGSGRVKRRSRSGKRYLFFPVDQKALNRHLDSEFKSRGWKLQPLIVSRPSDEGPKTKLKGDYKNGPLQVEAQFGNMARWYTDVFKFQLSYSLNEIDVAVLIVPMQAFARLIDENVASFERVCRELPWAKMSLTLPILVIGIEPGDYAPIKKRYEEAADALIAAKLNDGETVTSIPFSVRLEEELASDTADVEDVPLDASAE